VCSEADKNEECPSVGVTRYCPCPLDLRVQQLGQRLVDANVKNLVLRPPAKSSSSVWFPVNLRSQPPPSFPPTPAAEAVAESLLPWLSGSQKVRSSSRKQVGSWIAQLH